MGYKTGELEQLHEELYEILERVIEVCDRLGIDYTIIGGTAIGAHYVDGILPWDDDIDIGMERPDYDLFMRKAADVLPDGYTLQTPHNEPNTPYYFTKVRKDGTIFEPEDEAGLDIHHGIYVDIFPLDRVPDNPTMERIHRKAVRVLCNAFVAASGKLNSGFLVGRIAYILVAKILEKPTITMLMEWVHRWYEKSDCERVNIARMPRDHIYRETLHPKELRLFGHLTVKAPRKMLEYLECHYPHLEYPPEERQINHAPLRLEFSKRRG